MESNESRKRNIEEKKENPNPKTKTKTNINDISKNKVIKKIKDKE